MASWLLSQQVGTAHQRQRARGAGCSGGSAVQHGLCIERVRWWSLVKWLALLDEVMHFFWLNVVETFESKPLIRNASQVPMIPMIPMIPTGSNWKYFCIFLPRITGHET